jgi:sirohydrochlorin cobaltochelatase
MNARNLNQMVAVWVADGFRQIGQIRITQLDSGEFELRHVEDLGRMDLVNYEDPFDARHLSLTTVDGEFRPLKSAPNLRTGWRLLIRNIADLRAALDLFYPAMLGVWASHLRHELQPVSFRETLDRQTGMYAASKRLQEEEGQGLVANACSVENCTKRQLWKFAEDQTLRLMPADKCSAESKLLEGGIREIPLLCHEACNLLVAAARETVKKRERAASAGAAAAPTHGG